MGQKAQCYSLPSAVQSSVFGPTTVNKIMNNQIAGNSNLRKWLKHHKASLIQITFSSTKERIEGLGCIVRNCAFFDILVFSSKSFFFSLALSAKKLPKSCKKNINYPLHLKIKRGKKKKRPTAN